MRLSVLNTTWMKQINISIGIYKRNGAVPYYGPFSALLDPRFFSHSFLTFGGACLHGPHPF